MADFASSVSTQTGYKSGFSITNLQPHCIPFTTNTQVSQAILFCQGHSTPHAADYVNANLLDYVSQQIRFYPQQDLSLSLTNAYQQVQQDMWSQWQYIWPKDKSGHNCLSGTSATTVLITNDGNLITGHVGGSALYFASFNEKSQETRYFRMTSEHSLKNQFEFSNILHKAGCNFDGFAKKQETDELAERHELCFAWNPNKCLCKPSSESTKLSKLDAVPMTPLTRTLGDFWNYNEDLQDRFLSAKPEIVPYRFQPSAKNYLIFFSEQMEKLIDKHLIVDAIKLAQRNIIESLAYHFMETAAARIHRDGKNKFENLAVLVYPLFHSSAENVSEQLSKLPFGEHEIYWTYKPKTETQLALTPVERIAVENIPNVEPQNDHSLFRYYVESVNKLLQGKQAFLPEISFDVNTLIPAPEQNENGTNENLYKTEEPFNTEKSTHDMENNSSHMKDSSNQTENISSDIKENSCGIEENLNDNDANSKDTKENSNYMETHSNCLTENSSGTIQYDAHFNPVVSKHTENTFDVRENLETSIVRTDDAIYVCLQLEDYIALFGNSEPVTNSEENLPQAVEIQERETDQNRIYINQQIFESVSSDEDSGAKVLCGQSGVNNHEITRIGQHPRFVNRSQQEGNADKAISCGEHSFSRDENTATGSSDVEILDQQEHTLHSKEASGIGEQAPKRKAPKRRKTYNKNRPGPLCSKRKKIQAANSKKRIVYQSIGGVRVKVDPNSILKLTGKAPEECFKELRPISEKNVPCICID